MRKIFIFLFLFPILALADIIYIPHAGSSTALAVEAIASFKKIHKPHTSYLLWGGYGRLMPLAEEGDSPGGFECALEYRYYKLEDRYKGLFIGSYFGGAYMIIPHMLSDFNYYGFSAGLKAGYKFSRPLTKEKDFGINLLAEPYSSISLSKYRDVDYDEWYLGDPLITVGVRFVLEWLIIR